MIAEANGTKPLSTAVPVKPRPARRSRYEAGRTAAGDMQADFAVARSNWVAGVEARVGGYDSARTSRFGSQPSLPNRGAGADYHYLPENEFLLSIERSRNLMRNAAVIRFAIKRLQDTVIQGGFKLDPQTGDKELDLDLWERFEDWSKAKNCDISRERSWLEIQQRVYHQHKVDGDHFVLLTDEQKLELVEAHRCLTPRFPKRKTNPNLVHGVELNGFRERVAFYFSKEEMGIRPPLTGKTDFTRIPVRDVNDNRQALQIYQPERVSQTRGVPEITAVMQQAGMFDDLLFAKLVQAQATSCFAFIEETPMGALNLDDDVPTGESETDQNVDGTERIVDGISPGLKYRPAPGVTVKPFSAGVPNAEFFDHARLLLSLIGNTLGVPLVMLMLDASETNFSGWRGAIDQAKTGFRNDQRMMIDRLCIPVYEWWLRHEIAADPVLRQFQNRSDVDLFSHVWNAPGWPYIEPKKDSEAEANRVNEGQSSRRREAQAKGLDNDTIDTELVDDNGSRFEKAILRAQDLNQRYPEAKVDWRECLKGPFEPKAPATPATPDEVADAVANP